VSFWSSHSVVDSLFSDDPPTRLGQTLSADQASLFIPHPPQHQHSNHHQQQDRHHPRWVPRRGSAHAVESSSDTDVDLSFQLQHGHFHNQPAAQQQLYHQPSHYQRNQHHQPSHLQHLGASLGPQRSSFDEGSFYSGTTSLFSTSPILSPPASPAISFLFPPEDFIGGGRLVDVTNSNGSEREARQSSRHHHHSGSFAMPRKHSHPIQLGSSPSSSSSSSSSSSVSGSNGKYPASRPSASGLPNGIGPKQQPQSGGGHYSNGVGAYGHQQYTNGNASGAYGFRSPPPRSRGNNGCGGALNGSGGYPIASSHPRQQLRNTIGGSSPRSSPPRQAHSFLSTALNGSASATSNGHKGGSILASAPSSGGGASIKSSISISISLDHSTSGNNNICYDDEAAALLGVSPGRGLGLGIGTLGGPLSPSSRPIQIARPSSNTKQQQLTAGGSMGPRSVSPLNSNTPSPNEELDDQREEHEGDNEDDQQLGEGSRVRDTDFEETSDLLILPSTILQHIFSYLSGRDLGHLEQVCRRRLSYFANDDELWKDLYLRRYKLLDLGGEAPPPVSSAGTSDRDDEGSESDEWAWIYSLLHQKERWKDIHKTRFLAEQWRIGSLKMFNGCWGFISQTPNGPACQSSEQMLDIFFHRKDIAPDGEWYEDWWLKDTPGVSRSQKCSYWDTFLCGRIVRYKQRAAYAQGRRPQACNISFVGEERRDPVTGEPLPALHDAKIAQRSLASRTA